MHKITQPKLYTRGDILWIRFSLNGEVIRKSLNIEDNKVNRHLANTQIIPQLILKVNTGEFFESDKPKIPTLDEYALISFDAHKFERKATTTTDYKNIYKKHIKPHFGNKKIDSIKVSEINVWKNRLFSELGLSSTRVNDIKKILGTIIEDAVRDEIIAINPVRKSKALPAHQQKSIEPFSLDEIDLILKSASGQDKNIVATLFMTGMRTGELIGLKWSDIDLQEREISIKRTVGRGIENTPKTASSVRTIPILNSLFHYLVDQFDITGDKNSYVFLNINDNHFFDSKNLRDGFWKKVLIRAKVRYRTIYQTRHTFCSINLQNGEDLIWVSRIMGHKNPRITLEKYSKYIPSNTQKGTVFDKLAS
jgi:integrase